MYLRDVIGVAPVLSSFAGGSPPKKQSSVVEPIQSFFALLDSEMRVSSWVV